jgi:hypothetical protein
VPIIITTMAYICIIPIIIILQAAVPIITTMAYICILPVIIILQATVLKIIRTMESISIIPPTTF